MGGHACFATPTQSAGRVSLPILSLAFEGECVLKALVCPLQGSFVASMTAILRQMDDYHYAHLIGTFGKIRSDVVVSTPVQRPHRHSMQQLQRQLLSSVSFLMCLLKIKS